MLDHALHGRTSDGKSPRLNKLGLSEGLSEKFNMLNISECQSDSPPSRVKKAWTVLSCMNMYVYDPSTHLQWYTICVIVNETIQPSDI
jgi:hypothetical protein